MISGDDISKVRFGYRFMVSNGGRGEANSKDKYYVGNVFIEPVNNLRFSVTKTTIKLATGFGGSGAVRMGELILSCMYMGDKNLEFAYELFMPSISGQTASDDRIRIHYGYVGYKIKKATPYIQYYKGIATSGEGGTDVNSGTLGIRYNITPLAVFKAEVQLLEEDDFSKVNQIKLQWAIGF